METPFETLRSQWPWLPHHSLYNTTHYIGASSRTQVALAGPIDGFPKDYQGDKSLGAIDFRAFFVKPGDKPAYSPEQSSAAPASQSGAAEQSSGQFAAGDEAKKPVARKTMVAEGDAQLLQQELPNDIAKQLQLKKANSYLLQVSVPDRASRHWTIRHRRLVVVGCASGLPKPLFWAESEVQLSPFWPPIIGGIAFDVVLYLLATTWVYLDRLWSEREAKTEKRKETDAIAAGTTIKVGRFADVKHWSWWRCLDPVVLSSDMFDRGNLAKLQILFFLLLVGYGLVYFTLRTGELSTMSTSVVYLLGVSAFGALGSKVTSVAKDRISTENWAWLVGRRVLPINDPGEGGPKWTDLVMSDAEIDIYKLQAAFFSLIVGGAMILGGFSLSTFSVPQEMIEILGLSQLVFIGGRLAQPASINDLDKLITELKKREDELRRAAASGTDVDADGKPLLNQTPRPVSKTLADAIANVPNAVRRYEETANEVNVLLKALSHRDVDFKILETPQLP